MQLKDRLITKVKNLTGKRVLLRLDLNVPIGENGEIENTFRLEAVIPTIKYLVNKKAKVIIVSHLGSDGEKSLATIVNYLSKHFQTIFFPDLDNLFQIEKMKNGEVAILENIRRAAGEMLNDDKVAKWLAELGDIYVNDAFAVSHREQSSIVGVPKYLPSYVGPLFMAEYDNLAKAFTPDHPFLFILGGAKFKTKIPLLKKFIAKADNVFVGGALANTFYHKLGFRIGKSLFDGELPGLTEFLKNKKLKLPSDVAVAHGAEKLTRSPEKVQTNEIISDIGPETLSVLKKIIAQAQFILWNGPLGNFEKGFDWGTKELAKAIAGSKAFSVVGGGDTVSAIADLGLDDKFGFVSTAGGAMLDFLGTGTLPGIEAILKSVKS